jgi:cytochrome c peroxidase
MQSFLTNRRFLRRVSLIALILLSCLAAVLWQRLQTPYQPKLTTTEQVETRTVREPIQPIPLAIALDPNKVALGKQLFQDVRFSQDNRVSCLSCHSFSMGGADRRAYSIGVNGALGNVNTPSVFNAAFNFRLNWDGEFDNLTTHLDGLVENPLTLGSQWNEVVNKLRQSTEYIQGFAGIYPDGLTRANIQDALTTYEQSLYTPNSRFDQFLRGNKQALTAAEQEGYRIFKAYGCVSCHQGVNVGGNIFQKFGVIGNYFADRGNITQADLGRYNVTKDKADRYVFRVPTLRNVALTPPYFHDGSAKTLEDAIAVMAKYQLGRPLAKAQINSIAQFLHSLTGEYQGKPL